MRRFANILTRFRWPKAIALLTVFLGTVASSVILESFVRLRDVLKTNSSIDLK
jgi:hypothetical protein